MKLNFRSFFAGDGMFAELFNGLLFRSIKDKFNQDLVNDPNAEEWISSNDLPKPIVRIGVVPGGSTDAVAMSNQFIIFYYLPNKLFALGFFPKYSTIFQFRFTWNK